MICSMTGFGQGCSEVDGVVYTVEVRSVNNRYFKAQIRMPEEHRTLRGREFSIARSDGIQTHVIESADGIVSTLAEHFSIDMPEVADLWPRIAARHEVILREKAVEDTYEIRDRPKKQSPR